MRSTHASGAALFGSAPRTAQRARRPLAVSAASTAGNGELRARYAVRPLLGRREEAAATLARWAREVADGDGSRSVGNARLELSARVHGSAWGGDTVELEVTLDERQLPRLLALLRSPLHARWERELAPFVTGTAAPTWEVLAELSCESLPSRAPARQVGADVVAPAPSMREPGSTGTPPPLLVMPDAAEVEALLMEEVEVAAKSFPGRARSSVSGDVRIVLGGDEPTAVPQGVSTEALLAAVEPLLGAASSAAAGAAAVDEDVVDPFAELRATLKPGQYLARDWKGDPIIMNPGDNCPGLRPL